MIPPTFFGGCDVACFIQVFIHAAVLGARYAVFPVLKYGHWYTVALIRTLAIRRTGLLIIIIIVRSKIGTRYKISVLLFSPCFLDYFEPKLAKNIHDD